MMDIYFKVYSKDNRTNSSDSVFRIIGSNEPALTKGLSYCLSYSEELLRGLLKKLHITPDGSVIVSAEQSSAIVKLRRDIAIAVKNKNDSWLIVIEAKNPSLKSTDENNLTDQISGYFSRSKFPDVDDYNHHIAISLTKERLILRSDTIQITSITWNDIITLLARHKKHDIILNDYYRHLTEESSVKTYDEEVFSPPCAASFMAVSELSIYCCPADRTLKECLYLMPRIPVNGNEKFILDLYPDTLIDEKKGRGCCYEMYRIVDSFVVKRNSLDLIEDEDIKDRVTRWFDTFNESDQAELKVYVLAGNMKFDRPKFTRVQNNSFQGYYTLNEIWGDTIEEKGK